MDDTTDWEQVPPTDENKFEFIKDENLVLYSGFYFMLGFDLDLICPETNDYLRIWCSDYYKAGTVNIGSLKDPKFSFLTPEAGKRNWSKLFDSDPNSFDTYITNATGVGVNLGTHQLRALDFDNCSDFSLIDEVLELLGLWKGYPWVTLSGSGKGFHIIYYSENAVTEKSVLALRANSAFIRGFTHLEIRESGFLVLPPSKNGEGGKYKFRNGGIPKFLPFSIPNYSIRNLIKKLCCNNSNRNEAIDFTKIDSDPDFVCEFISATLNNLSDRITKVSESYYVIIDTETTGMPLDYDRPASDLKNWPRLVQLAWIVYNHSGKAVKIKSRIIYPDFSIPKESTEIHGISKSNALVHGIQISVVLNEFIEDIKEVEAIVGHNIDFDINVLSAEFIRLLGVSPLNRFNSLCTMKSSLSLFKDGKYPKLAELYQQLFSKSPKNQHSALGDAKSTAECFFELRRKNLI